MYSIFTHNPPQIRKLLMFKEGADDLTAMERISTKISVSYEDWEFLYSKLGTCLRERLIFNCLSLFIASLL